MPASFFVGERGLAMAAAVAPATAAATKICYCRVSPMQQAPTLQSSLENAVSSSLAYLHGHSHMYIVFVRSTALPMLFSNIPPEKNIISTKYYKTYLVNYNLQLHTSR